MSGTYDRIQDLREPPACAPCADQPRTRVLVVDDDPVGRLLCVNYCDLFDLDCAGVATDEEALATLKADSFDVVVMNVHMDGGHEALRRIRRIAPAAPVIGLTALGRDDEAQRWLGAGLASVLSKPVTAARLYTALADAAEPPADASRSWAPARRQGTSGP